MDLTNNTASDQTVSGRVYARDKEGRSLSLIGPASLTVAAGNTIHIEFTQTIPPTLPAQNVEFFAAFESAGSFDEDKTVFTITP